MIFIFLNECLLVLSNSYSHANNLYLLLIPSRCTHATHESVSKRTIYTQTI